MFLLHSKVGYFSAILYLVVDRFRFPPSTLGGGNEQDGMDVNRAFAVVAVKQNNMQLLSSSKSSVFEFKFRRIIQSRE